MLKCLCIWLAVSVPFAAALGAQDAERQRLESLLARSPRDAVLLFHLAAHHAAAGRRDTTLALLDAMQRAPGGLDPSFNRTFAPLYGDSGFQRIVGRIRAANPPRVRSTSAYTIAEADLHPEGIAFDPVSRALFVGSFKGKVVRVDSAGRATDFAYVSRPEAPRVVVGVRVDIQRRHLWAAVDDPRAFADATVHGGALMQWDLTTGALVAGYRGREGAFNDVVIAPNGDAYTTNTITGAVWRVHDREFAEFLPPGTVPEANGIAISPDGQSLYVAGWHDIVRVDVATRRTRALTAPPGVVTASFDGLYWYDGGLIGVQNGLHPGRVVRLMLAGDRITRADILEQYHPRFGGMTTGALDGASLLYLLNTQSRAFNADGTLKPGAALRSIEVLRLPLR